MRRRAMRHDIDGVEDGQAGFSLVESLVAMMLVTIAIFALVAELTSYVHHQANEKARTSAVRYMTDALESARSLTASALKQLSTGPQTIQPKTINGVTFSMVETLERCTVTDPTGTCTTPASDAVLDTRIRITVSWADGTSTRSISTYGSLADTSNGKYVSTGSGTISSLVGATTPTNGISVTSFTASPSPMGVSAAGQPTSAVSLTLNTVGLTASTTAIPVTWTDDNGGHQTSLTGGPSAWTGTVPASSITKVVSSGTSTVRFAATVPGTSALATADLTVKPNVAISSCTVSPAAIVLTPLTRKNALNVVLTCTVSGLTTADSVTAAYTSGTSTATKSMTSTNGTTWTYTIPSGTNLANAGLTETFTFTATRASDSWTATATTTAAMA